MACPTLSVPGMFRLPPCGRAGGRPWWWRRIRCRGCRRSWRRGRARAGPERARCCQRGARLSRASGIGFLPGNWRIGWWIEGRTEIYIEGVGGRSVRPLRPRNGPMPAGYSSLSAMNGAVSAVNVSLSAPNGSPKELTGRFRRGARLRGVWHGPQRTDDRLSGVRGPPEIRKASDSEHRERVSAGKEGVGGDREGGSGRNDRVSCAEDRPDEGNDRVSRTVGRG